MPPGILGAVLGLFGALISRGFDILEKFLEMHFQNQQNQSAKEILALEIEQYDKRSAHEQKMAMINKPSSLVETENSIDYPHDVPVEYRPGVFQWVDCVRQLMRPLLTLMYSALFLICVYFISTPEALKEHSGLMISSFLELTISIVFWWFGIRKSK